MTTHFFGDTAVLLRRTMSHITRSPDTIITVSIMPIALMLLFRYVLGGAINTGQGPGQYLNYVLPGILLITIATGISYTRSGSSRTCKPESSSDSSPCRSRAPACCGRTRRPQWSPP